MNSNINSGVSRVARMEDMPYFNSPPIQFVYSQKAPLTLGTYPFVLTKSALRNTVQLTDNSLIYIRDISFYADIPEQDYQFGLKLAAGNTDVPRFSLYMAGNAGVPVFRNPIELGKYFREQSYRKIIMPKFTPNNLLGAIQGTIQQHGGLAGVAEINITVELYCQEIVDDAFIAALLKKYPDGKKGGMYI